MQQPFRLFPGLSRRRWPRRLDNNGIIALYTDKERRMKRSGSRTMLLLGAVVALAVFLIVYVVMQPPPAPPVVTPTPTPIQVVVAVGEGLQPNKVITDEQLDYTNVDGSTVPTT